MSRSADCQLELVGSATRSEPHGHLMESPKTPHSAGRDASLVTGGHTAVFPRCLHHVQVPIGVDCVESGGTRVGINDPKVKRGVDGG